MDIKPVEIRELKAQLSAYLKLVKDGHILVITEGGKPIARIEPMPQSFDEKMKEPSEAGILNRFESRR